MNLTRIIGVGLAIMLFLAILVSVNLQKKEDSNISVLMRIMTNYVQIFAAALAFNLEFPTYITSVFSSASQVGGSSGVFLSFDWLLLETPVVDVFENIAFFKVLCLAVLPIILILVPVIICRFVLIKDSTKFKRFTWVVTITCIFMLHPSLTQYCLRLFKWIDIGNGESRVEMDITTKWWSYRHLKWVFSLGLPMLFIYVIG